MNKIILVILLCASLIFAASCGNAPSESTDSTTANDTPAIAEVSAENDTPKKEDIFGSIKEIAGNLATIELAVMPENGIPIPGERRMGNFDPENLPEGVEIMTNENGDFAGMDGAGTSFSVPEGFEIPTNEDGSYNIPEGAMERFGESRGGGSVTRNEDGSITLPDGSIVSGDEMETMRQSVGANSVFLEYTGDEIEFILPIGTPIYAVTKDEESNQIEIEIDLNDIKNNNVISITYKADGKTIEKILVSQVAAAKRPEGWERPESEINEETTADNGGGIDE